MSETVAIIVTFNRKEMLLACLDALAKQSSACDVLVVDNASSDGTADAVRPRLAQRVGVATDLGGREVARVPPYEYELLRGAGIQRQNRRHDS